MHLVLSLLLIVASLLCGYMYALAGVCRTGHHGSGVLPVGVTEVASYYRLKMVCWCHQMLVTYSSWGLGVTDSSRVLLLGVMVMFVISVVR